PHLPATLSPYTTLFRSAPLARRLPPEPWIENRGRRERGREGGPARPRADRFRAGGPFRIHLARGIDRLGPGLTGTSTGHASPARSEEHTSELQSRSDLV